MLVITAEMNDWEAYTFGESKMAAELTNAWNPPPPSRKRLRCTLKTSVYAALPPDWRLTAPPSEFDVASPQEQIE